MSEIEAGKMKGQIKPGVTWIRTGTVNGGYVKTEPMEFKAGEAWFAAAMLVMGYLYWELIHFASFSAGVTIFGLLLCAVTLGYFKFSGVKQTPRSLVWLGLTLLSLAQLSLFDNQVIKNFNFIFLTAAFIYWVCLSAGRAVDGKLSIYLLGDILNQTIIVPFSNFTSCIGGLVQKDVKNKKKSNVLVALAGLLISLPVILVVLGLLTTADATFETWMGRLTETLLSVNILDKVLKVILGIPVALYIGGLIFGNVKGRATDRIQKDGMNQYAAILRKAPGLMVYSPMFLLCIIYLIFFAAQITYFFSAFSDALPQSMTYAEYARRGFFELCTVSGINLAVMAVAHVFTKRGSVAKEKDARGETDDGAVSGADAAAISGAGVNADVTPKVLRVETVALCIVTLLMIVTAISKMVMYIQYFGLTQLRVYTTWFMVLLFFIFVVVAIRQIRRFNAARIITIGFIVLFMGLCYGNADGLITKYNIERYEAGTLEFMDEEVLWRLSDAAIPYLYEVYQTTGDEAVKTRIHQVITGEYEWGGISLPYKKTFRDFNLQGYKADQIREILNAEPQEEKTPNESRETEN